MRKRKKTQILHLGRGILCRVLTSTSRKKLCPTLTLKQASVNFPEIRLKSLMLTLYLAQLHATLLQHTSTMDDSVWH